MDHLALALEKAAANQALKPEFARVLLTSTVYVMGEVEGADPRSGAPITGGQNVVLRSQLKPDGGTVVPFFSSLEKLRVFLRGPDEVPYLAMPATKLFEIARGSALVLNPGSPVRGEISPEDLAKLLLAAGEAPQRH